MITSELVTYQFKNRLSLAPENFRFLDSRSLPVNPLVKGFTKVDEQVRHQC
jgi:hypothetical protein